MNILVISYFHAFKDSVGSLRSRAMVKHLPDYGFEVYTLAMGNQRESIAFDEKTILVRDFNRRSIGTFPVMLWRTFLKVRNMLGIYTGSAFAWEYISMKNIKLIYEFAKPNLIMCSYPPVESFNIGLKLSKILNIPLIADFRDGFLFNPLEADLFTNKAKLNHYKKIERDIVRSSVLSITVSPPLSNYLHSKYKKKVETILNGFDEDYKYENVFGYLEEGAVNIVHTGRLSISQEGTDIKHFIRALENICKRNANFRNVVRIHFFGELNNNEKKWLNELVCLGVVKVWGHKQRETALNIQKRADILLLITKPYDSIAISGKLIEYIATKKPILGLTIGTEAEKIINELRCGITVPPDDIEKLENVFIKIANEKKLYNSEMKFDAIEKYSQKNQMQKLAKIIRDVYQ